VSHIFALLDYFIFVEYLVIIIIIIIIIICVQNGNIGNLLCLMLTSNAENIFFYVCLATNITSMDSGAFTGKSVLFNDLLN